MLRPGRKFYKRPSLMATVTVLVSASFIVPTALVLTARAETKAATEQEDKPAKSLHKAAADGDIEQVKGLISTGANVNAKDDNDWTPLHWAASHARKDIVELLIAKGADVNSKNKDGKTPADLAIEGMWPYSNETVRLLVDKGGGVSRLEGIYLAAYLGDLPRVKGYLKQGKDRNAKNKYGNTPLHVAAMAGEREMVEFLIADGAHVNMKDDAGYTALDRAEQHRYFDTVELLLAKGATTTAPKGWYRRGSHPKDYEMTVDKRESHGGKASAHIKFTAEKPVGFGTLMQSFRADEYRGKRVEMSAWMKTQEAQSAQLWMRLDGAKTVLRLNNMDDRPVQGTTDWHRYQITLDVPEDTVSIVFGAFVAGSGQAWVDDFAFNVVGKQVPSSMNMLTEEDMNVDWGDLARMAYRQQPVNLDFEYLQD